MDRKIANFTRKHFTFSATAVLTISMLTIYVFTQNLFQRRTAIENKVQLTRKQISPNKLVTPKLSNKMNTPTQVLDALRHLDTVKGNIIDNPIIRNVLYRLLSKNNMTVFPIHNSAKPLKYENIVRRYQSSNDAINILRPYAHPDISCRLTKTNPPFQACLLPKGTSYTSSVVNKSGLWESEVVKPLQKALGFYPNATFVDVGANIGFFATLVAAMKRDVIAVEPVRHSARCIQKNIVLNRLEENLILVNNALSDRRATMMMLLKDTNAGENKIMPLGLKIKEKSLTANITAIYMDDLLPLIHSKDVILKIDVEGHECQALKISDEIFSRKNVRYIFMEWMWLLWNSKKKASYCPAAQLRKLVERFKAMGYIPYYKGRLLNYNMALTDWKYQNIYWQKQNSRQL